MRHPQRPAGRPGARPADRLGDPTARGTERVMIEIYRRLPGYMGSTLSAIVDRLLEGGVLLLVHCSAGKDRTGFVIAMLLRALEVPEPIIRADYLASRNWPGAELHRASLEERFRGRSCCRTSCAPRWMRCSTCATAYLDAALGAVHQEFGSIERYLESEADSTLRGLSRCARTCSRRPPQESRRPRSPAGQAECSARSSRLSFAARDSTSTQSPRAAAARRRSWRPAAREFRYGGRLLGEHHDRNVAQVARRPANLVGTRTRHASSRKSMRAYAPVGSRARSRLH